MLFSIALLFEVTVTVPETSFPTKVVPTLLIVTAPAIVLFSITALVPPVVAPPPTVLL